MKQIRYEFPVEQINSLQGPTLFLAGPTVRGHQTHLQPSWRFEACNILEKHNFDGNVIIPEFQDVTVPDKGSEDWIVPWEHEGLTKADVIIFWIPRTKELIGLNTNFELGYWLGKEPAKLVYGRPDNSYRNKYIDIMWERITRQIGEERQIIGSLEETCIAALKEITFSYHST